MCIDLRPLKRVNFDSSTVSAPADSCSFQSEGMMLMASKPEYTIHLKADQVEYIEECIDLAFREAGGLKDNTGLVHTLVNKIDRLELGISDYTMQCSAVRQVFEAMKKKNRFKKQRDGNLYPKGPKPRSTATINRSPVTAKERPSVYRRPPRATSREVRPPIANPAL